MDVGMFSRNGFVACALTLCGVAHADDRWWSANEDRVFPSEISYPNANGVMTTLNANGPTRAKDHPFFTAIGTNGRACVTCHQPADAMSLSAATARERWQATGGKDPLFAAIDGSNCPSLPQEQASSHSLLLDRGLIRVSRPWPPREFNGSPVKPQFTIEVIRDPTGCNLSPVYGLRTKSPAVSVYRRIRPATNAKYLTSVGFNFDPKNGLPLPVDKETGELVSGNLLADARAPTLFAQARDAMHSHLQIEGAPDEKAVKQIVAFVQGLYTAQSVSTKAGALDDGATGGPKTLMQVRAGELQGGPMPIWLEYLPWLNSRANDAQGEMRKSIARGADLFAKKMFLVDDSMGINNMGFGNPVRNACAFCHNMLRTGMDVAPGQVDIGTVNSPHATPSPELPLFKLTCNADAPPHPYLGRVIFTQDPGYALSTGKCADIGKITAQSMRGLASRAPYFSNGSAKTLEELVDYYDRRYRIGLSDQEKKDLVNLMGVL
jgi:hypothetical protein